VGQSGHLPILHGVLKEHPKKSEAREEEKAKRWVLKDALKTLYFFRRI